MMGQRGTLDPDYEKYSSWRTTNMAFFLPVYESQFNLVLVPVMKNTIKRFIKFKLPPKSYVYIKL